MRYTSKYLEIS